MFESPDVFTDEVIVDELLGFFAAGAGPIAVITQTLLSYLSKSPASLKKLRTEYDAKF